MSAVAIEGQRKDKRPVHTFTFEMEDFRESTTPEKMPKTVGMRALTADEELESSKKGRGDGTKAHFEAIKLCVCQMDGKNVHNGEGVIDTFWNNCGPPARSLLALAYDKINSPTKERAAGFLASEKAVV